MRAKGEKGCFLFRKGVIIYNTHLFQLLKSVRELYDVKYIMTTCITQDNLSSFLDRFFVLVSFTITLTYGSHLKNEQICYL